VKRKRKKKNDMVLNCATRKETKRKGEKKGNIKSIAKKGGPMEGLQDEEFSKGEY